MNNEAVVIDANIAIKWVLLESDSETAKAMLAEWKKQKMVIYVPTLLSYEVTNILYREVRSRRITAQTAKAGINMILRAVSPVYSRNSDLNLGAMDLAKHFDLPATYDTHYLALAERKDCPFWTADVRMWRVVKDQLNWVHYIGDYAAN